jgi:hypothetical protein
MNVRRSGNALTKTSPALDLSKSRWSSSCRLDMCQGRLMQQPLPERPEVHSIAKAARNNRDDFSAGFRWSNDQSEEGRIEVHGFNTNIPQQQPIFGTGADLLIWQVENSTRVLSATE